MAAQNPDIKQAREDAKAQIAAIRSGGDFTSQSEAALLEQIDTLNENAASADAIEGAVSGAQLVGHVRKLSRTVSAIIRREHQKDKAMKALFAKIKKYVDDADDGIIERMAKIEAHERNLHAQAYDARDDASIMFGGLEPLIRVGLTYINSGDKVVNPLALTLSEAVRAYPMKTTGGESTRELLADALKAFAYYDPAVGFSSIWTADAPAPTTTTVTEITL